MLEAVLHSEQSDKSPKHNPSVTRNTEVSTESLLILQHENPETIGSTPKLQVPKPNPKLQAATSLLEKPKPLRHLDGSRPSE